MQYLEIICETTGDEYGEPLELQHRYEIQLQANQNLQISQKTGNEDLNEVQREIRKKQQERSTDTQVKNTRIAQMRKKLDECRQQVFNLTQQAEKQESKKLEQTHQLGQVRMALDNTFARCVRQTTLTSKADRLRDLKDPEGQLDFIGEFCCDLAEICKTAEKQAREQTKKKEAEIHMFSSTDR